MVHKPSYIENIIYMSTICCGADDISDLARKAEANNKKNGVTGLLLKRGAYFIQYLEGSMEVAPNLYNIIKHDQRHDHVVLLYNCIARQRIFPNWHMQDSESMIRLALDKHTKGQVDSRKPIEILQSFIDAKVETRGLAKA